MIHLGAAYYPEHWSEDRWSNDIRLMREAGLTVVRMGEFAWSTYEPVEGEFHFDWLDRAIQMLAGEGIRTVLGTPTAAPPAWLVQAYPDILTVDENGRRVQFGNRCHYCVNSPEFHAAARRIVGAMAEQFGPNLNVIGWQLDNEYNQVCYCEHCQRLFQNYLMEKFGSLDALNEHWSTRYWSQTYSDWKQIPIPIGYHNPGLMLEFKRFITNSYHKYQKLQLDILRPCLRPGVWVTHNFMGWFDGLDHYVMTEDLDLASWDWYIGNGHHDYLTSGAIHDLTRGFKRRNFWVMETQPGRTTGWTICNDLNKGESRAMAWHAIAHGADAILYWQWRMALGGQEQYWGTVVDQSGQPRPFYEEVQQIGREFHALAELLDGSTVHAEVAMLNDYDSRWSLHWQRHQQDFDYVNHFNQYFRPLAGLNVPVDVLSAKALTSVEQLAGYRLVIAPALLLVNDEIARALRDYVARGGHLVLTLRSGMKDEYNALLPDRQPGPFGEIAGVEVEDYYALEDQVPVKANWFEGQSHIWAERLKVVDQSKAQVLARYGSANGWLDNQVAISVSDHGNGQVYYAGAYLDDAAQHTFMAKVLETAGVTLLDTPLGIEVYKRVKPDNGEIYFVINHTPEAKTVVLPWSGYEHLSKQAFQSELKLGRYDVAIFTRQ